jgi:hypothetical protein
MIMKNKTVIILRAAPGAGKSTLAEILDDRANWHTVCADDYLWKDGKYDFSLAKGGANHIKCQARFIELLEDEFVEGIVVANTNTKPEDFKFYEDAAAKVGAMVFHLVVENRHGGVNSHGVPYDTIARMKSNLRNNIVL